MILVVFYSVILILCVLGISELIFGIKLFALKGDKDAERYLLLYLGENDYYSQLACAIEKMNWYGNIYDKILAITDNIDEEDISECKKVVSFYETKNVMFCKREEINLID